jgi:heptosyltransferase II
MSFRNLFRKSASAILKKYLSVPEQRKTPIGSPARVLIIRQHNQFGDMLASVSLFRAVKETYPDSEITLLASRENFYAVYKNEFLDKVFVYDNRKITKPAFLKELKTLLSENYDLVIVPATVAVSATSCLLAAFARGKMKIGPRSLNRIPNDYSYVFTHPVNLDWQRYPDAHVSDFILDIVRPFGIKTENFSSSVTFDENDKLAAMQFLNGIGPDLKIGFIVGFHIGAGKPQNRWPVEKYCGLIDSMKLEFGIRFYFTGSSADQSEINEMKKRYGREAGYFINMEIPRLAAVLAASSLFITNDTGVMHVAGATPVPQISLFGPTNPFNWAPVGPLKYFIRKSELIDEVSVEDVMNLARMILRSTTGK